MSALAQYCVAEKKVVSGSDRTMSSLTNMLINGGIEVFEGHRAKNITDDIDLVVYTEAVTRQNPELKAAKNLNIPVISYFEALGLFMNQYYLIAVAGTHGKTTTTAMLTEVFEAAGKDPTAIIGSPMIKTGTNYRYGKTKYAIVEACEYRQNFLSLTPDVLVITNLEHEHVDCYKDLEAVQKAFKKLISQVHETGVVVTDTANKNIKPIISDCHVPVINYLDNFTVDLNLKQPGIHNKLNAAVALTVAKHEDLDEDLVMGALSDFSGTKRRFEYMGKVNGALVYTDYAHHPSEIKVTIRAAKEFAPDKNIVAVFQPHTYSRTEVLFNDFAASLSGVDTVILLPIYSAREKNKKSVSSRELSVKTLEFVPNVRYMESPEEVIKKLRQTLTAKDLLLVMGAGDVNKIAEAVIEAE